MLESKLANMCVDDVQADEVWSFVGCKEKTRAAMSYGQEFGDAQCFIGIERACTSHIERSNLSLRMATRRFTRLTNAFSKKWENHEAALALWFAFYNYCRKHMTLKETPAMASGLEDHVWTIRELIEESARA